MLTSDAFLAILVGLMALGVYLRTLLPDVGGLEDSPKFQYLGAVLGTSHAPGYPLHTMLSHAFSHLPVGTIAYRANLMSAVFGVVAVSLAVLLARATGSSRAAAAMGALALAFGAAFWHFAVLAEVYTLGAALLLGIMYGLVRWRQTGRDLHLFAAAGCFALAIGNHLSIAAAAPGIAIFLLVTDARRALRLRTLVPAAAIVASGFLQYAYILIRTRQGSSYREASARTLAELVDVVRARDYQDHVFAFGWQELLATRLSELWRLVRAELGLIGIGLALLGLIVLFRRDRRVAALLTLTFGGFCLLLANLAGDLRGFLVVPLALAAPALAAGADALRSLGARLPGRRVWAALSAIVLLLYPAWLARVNFDDNDWHQRTADAVFFRALVKQLPARVALLPEDYIADSIVTYLQAAERGDEERTLVSTRTDPDSVRELFAAGTPVVALDARYVELAPRGFQFDPVDLGLSRARDGHDGHASDVANASARSRTPLRHAYRLVRSLTTIDFGDAAWHDITAAAEDGSVGVLVDNYDRFDARVTLYAAGPAPFRPTMYTEQYRYGQGRPSFEAQVYDLAIAQERDAFRLALAADGAGDASVAAAAADRYAARIEGVVNDRGQYAAWAVNFGGVPRRVIGRAQVDRPHVRRALVTALPPERLLAGRQTDDVPMGTSGDRWFGPGWHRVERDAGGEFRWTAAPDAWLVVPSAVPGPVTMTVTVMSRAGATVRPIVNGRALTPCAGTGGWQSCSWTLDSAVLKVGGNAIALRTSRGTRPSDDGVSRDTRWLGVAVRGIQLTR